MNADTPLRYPQPGDVISLPEYWPNGREQPHRAFLCVEMFRGCPGVFCSDDDRTAGVFLPLCEMYRPAKDSTEKYIGNYGNYQTKMEPSWRIEESAQDEIDRWNDEGSASP